MAELPRLNKVIEALASGKPAFTSFCQADPETAIAMATAKYDGIVFEMEHNPWDIRALRDSLQYMLNRGQIAASGSVAPAVTPMVRIPPNGGEHNQWLAKQALDLGVYGIVWPHISSVEEAQLAIRYGASAVGLVSAMPSGPGIITEERIAQIAEVIPPPIASFLLTSQQEAEAIIARLGRSRSAY